MQIMHLSENGICPKFAFKIISLLHNGGGGATTAASQSLQCNACHSIMHLKSEIISIKYADIEVTTVDGKMYIPAASRF